MTWDSSRGPGGKHERAEDEALLWSDGIVTVIESEASGRPAPLADFHRDVAAHRRRDDGPVTSQYEDAPAGTA